MKTKKKRHRPVPTDIEHIQTINKRSKADPDTGCMIWQGATLPTGYGVASVNKRPLLAHRLSYAAHYAKDPGELCVLHTCDNPPCVNPSHLELGTQLENIRQRDERERTQRGVDHYRAKLDPAKIEEARELREAEGLTYKALGERYGVTAMTIWRALNGKSWTHLDSDCA